jgi:hypothetical protein
LTYICKLVHRRFSLWLRSQPFTISLTIYNRLPASIYPICLPQVRNKGSTFAILIASSVIVRVTKLIQALVTECLSVNAHIQRKV